MKTVAGKVVSTKPISLSTAARHLSRFTSLDNTASSAVRLYLIRASDAFNNLVRFHKELNNAPTSHHHKHKTSQILDYGVRIEALSTVEENPHKEKIKNVENKGKRKKNREFEINNEGPLKIEENAAGVAEKIKKKKLKNEESVMIERGEEGGEEEIDGGNVKRKDKKKRRKNEGEENGGSFEGETGKKRKRKSNEEVDGGETYESAEQSGKKKKRKKMKTERRD